MTRIALLPLLVSATALFAPSSHAADPTMADCLSASETSIKLRHDHHLREARQQLLVCAALTCPAEVRSECERRVVAVNAAIPTLVFDAKDAAGNDLLAVKVSMDGKPLAERLEGTAISIDPGAHAFHFESAGQAPIDKSFVLHEGEKDRRERITFGASASATTASPKKDVAAPVAAPPEPETNARSWGPLQTVGVVAGAVGLVGIGLGSAFGLMAASDKNGAACDPNGYCSPGPLSDARSHATVSTIGFVAGGVLLAAGVGLVIFGSRGKAESVQVAPAVGAGTSGVVVGGAF